MAPTGFEPATPGLKVQCSNQTELRSLVVFQSVEILFIYSEWLNQTEQCSRSYSLARDSEWACELATEPFV